MGRIVRAKKKKAARYTPNPYALVPVDKEGLKTRLERHASLMSELLSEGKDFNSLPVGVLKTIVRDFQIAGLDVPTPALQRIREHQQAGLANRPAPIFLPPVTDGVRTPDLRSELISRGFNPKTGFSESAPILPHRNPGLSRAGVALPYIPVHRYGKVNMFTEKANKTAASWLPPWMIYGDQPNQFVKTPRPESMGRGPSFEYVNGENPALRRAYLAGMRPSVAAAYSPISVPLAGAAPVVPSRLGKRANPSSSLPSASSPASLAQMIPIQVPGVYASPAVPSRLNRPPATPSAVLTAVNKLPVVPVTPPGSVSSSAASMAGSRGNGSSSMSSIASISGSPLAALSAADLDFLDKASIFELPAGPLMTSVITSPLFVKATSEADKKYKNALDKARSIPDASLRDDALDLINKQMEADIHAQFMRELRGAVAPSTPAAASRKSPRLSGPVPFPSLTPAAASPKPVAPRQSRATAGKRTTAKYTPPPVVLKRKKPAAKRGKK